MKKYIIFFVIVAINIPHNTEIFAKPVDIETAKALGSNFLKQPVTEAKTGNAFQSYNPPYYIFNVENNNGWVIVAGDDVMPAVLAYSNEGSWNADNIAPSAYFMLEMYEATFNNVDEFATQNEQWNDLLNTSKKTKLFASASRTINNYPMGTRESL